MNAAPNQPRFAYSRSLRLILLLAAAALALLQPAAAAPIPTGYETATSTAVLTALAEQPDFAAIAPSSASAVAFSSSSSVASSSVAAHAAATAAYAARLARTQSDRYDRSRAVARIALAKMGQGTWFADFIAGLASTDTARRALSVRALGQIGDKRAVPSLIPLLDDQSSPPRPGPGPARNPTFAVMAVQALDLILPDLYAQFLAASNGKRVPTARTWKAWWKVNGAAYQ